MIENLNNLDVARTGGKASKMDTSGLPGFGGGGKPSWDASKFRVKYKRVNVQDADDISELERIETAAIRDEGVYVLSKERFVFMDQILILLQYLERAE